MVRNVSGLTGQSYEEKLEELGMVTLERRRWEQDLIQTYKIIHGCDDVEKSIWFEMRDNEAQQRTRTAEGGLCIAGQLPKLEIRSSERTSSAKGL